MYRPDYKRPPGRWPMDLLHKGCFVMLIAMGLLGIAVGVVRLFDLPVPVLEDEQLTRPEMYVALAIGTWALLFGVTALRHARLELDAEEMRFLRFGPLCRTGRVPLADVRRFGVGVESSRHGKYRVLLIELETGGRVSFKLSMYKEWHGFIRELGERLDRAPAPMKRTWKGAAFEEEA